MMNLYSNSKGQRDPKLNKYQQVADRVQGAGHRDRQEIGKRGRGKPIHNDHNGDGDKDIFISPTLGSSGIFSTKDLLAWPTQNLDLKFHKTNASLPGGTHL